MNTAYIPTSHKRHNNIAAFTLIELMFVVGIITILGVIVGPGFKKAYEDYNVTKTIDEARALLNGVRSYYIIHNELPVDQDPGTCEKNFSHFIPSCLFAKTEKKLKNNTRGYDLIIKPYGGSYYDLDNWYSNPESPKTTSITMYFPTSVARDRIKSKLFILYPDASNNSNAMADENTRFALCWFLSEVSGNPDISW